MPIFLLARQRSEYPIVRVREFGRFLLVGGVGFVVDGGVLLLLVNVLGLSALWSRIPSFLVAVTATWWLHRKFTFESARRVTPSVGEWLRFVLGNALGNGANLLIYWFAVAVLGWTPLVALAVASVAAAGLNYGVSARWVFRRR